MQDKFPILFLVTINSAKLMNIPNIEIIPNIVSYSSPRKCHGRRTEFKFGETLCRKKWLRISTQRGIRNKKKKMVLAGYLPLYSQ